MDRKAALPIAEVYRSKRDGQWYWRMLAANGNVKCDGGEDYGSKAGAIAGLKTTVLPPYKLRVAQGNGLDVDVSTVDLGIIYPIDLTTSDNPENPPRVKLGLRKPVEQ